MESVWEIPSSQLCTKHDDDDDDDDDDVQWFVI